MPYPVFDTLKLGWNLVTPILVLLWSCGYVRWPPCIQVSFVGIWPSIAHGSLEVCTVPVLINHIATLWKILSASGNHDMIQCLLPISHLSCAMQISTLHTSFLQNDQMHTSWNTKSIFSLVARSSLSRIYLFPSYFHKQWDRIKCRIEGIYFFGIG